MSASLLPSSILPETIHSRFYRKASKTMAACVDNSRTGTASYSLSSDSDQSQMNYCVYKYVKFCIHSFSDQVLYPPISQDHHKNFNSPTIDAENLDRDGDEDNIWLKMREEALFDVEQEPILSNYYDALILSHNSLENAIANHLAIKLSNSNLPSDILFDVFLRVFTEDGEIMRAIRDDLRAVKDRDPACMSYIHCLLNFKGFQACQAHRVAHKLWSQGMKVFPLLIQNRVTEVFAVDIHPGAQIGRGILLDHATGVVIGETAVIGNYVSILHNVTLGGTGKGSRDRHPKIGDGVLIGAGTNILGNVIIGEGAKIGAGSVVLKEVPPRTTAVGNPARLVGGKENPIKLEKIPGFTMNHTSFISEWSDYVI
ncbi:hypothetical protein HHK36_002246 [Tetracentron sinense]|uniref:serine O-acetyltransferase n=1 Tax=Tetracentron sinense TaxID=13715 RepID=A0A835A469_TETSI|nr:hypothetical protein HHK36_002246 [Tetracentron sinense]